jgi:hypothetical protein
MFVTRAGRHDKEDLAEFVSAARGAEADVSKGTAMIAREGAIVGCVRIIEVATNTLVYDDLLIADHKDRATTKRLVQAAMNNKGGSIFTAADPADEEVLTELGFGTITRDDAPAPVTAYWADHPPLDGAIFLGAR